MGLTTVDVYFCRPAEIPAVWDEVKEYLEKALKHSRHTNLQNLRDNLLLDNYTLSLSMLDNKIIAACVTTITIDAHGEKACGVIACGGKVGKLYKWITVWNETTEKLAREADCKYMFVNGRKGWSRFGYKIINYEMIKEI